MAERSLSLIFFLQLASFILKQGEEKQFGQKGKLPDIPQKNDIGNYSKAAISSDHKLCSQIGVRTLQKGGNAVDAAVAVEFCLYLLDMYATGLGGGGKMLIYTKQDDKIHALNFRERAPTKAGEISNDAELKRGPLSIALPGNLLGLHTAWSRFGKAPWSELVKPSIAIAYKGFKMHSRLYQCTKNVVRHIRKDKTLRFRIPLTI